MAPTTSVEDKARYGSEPPSPKGLTPDARAETRQRSHWDLALQRFRRDRLALMGGIGVVALFMMALGAAWLAPHDPLFQFADGLSGDYAAPYHPWSILNSHWAAIR